MKRTRILAYDLIRTVSVAMAVMIHISAYLVTYFPGNGSSAFAVGNLFHALGRAGTPMLMMLTGACSWMRNTRSSPAPFPAGTSSPSRFPSSSGCSSMPHGGPF